MSDASGIAAAAGVAATGGAASVATGAGLLSGSKGSVKFDPDDASADYRKAAAGSWAVRAGLAQMLKGACAMMTVDSRGGDARATSRKFTRTRTFGLRFASLCRRRHPRCVGMNIINVF